MTIDDSMFTLGSANLNLRSFAVDSKINIATDDPIIARELRRKVWAMHTAAKFDRWSAIDVAVIIDTFQFWKWRQNDT